MKKSIFIIIIAIIVSSAYGTEVTRESLNISVNPVTTVSGNMGQYLKDGDIFRDALLDTFKTYGKKQKILSDLFTNSQVSIISEAAGNTISLIVIFNNFDLNLIQKSANTNMLDYIDVRLPGYLKLALDWYIQTLKMESGINTLTFDARFGFERGGSFYLFNMTRSFSSWTIHSITFVGNGQEILIMGEPYNQYYYIDPATDSNTGNLNTSSLLYAFFGEMSVKYKASDYF